MQRPQKAYDRRKGTSKACQDLVRLRILGLVGLATVEGVANLEVAVLLHVGAVVLEDDDRITRDVDGLQISHLLQDIKRCRITVATCRVRGQAVRMGHGRRDCTSESLHHRRVDTPAGEDT